jgi:hypothetical protein
MSRFDGARWNRILVWTGAALAWGTAFIATWLEPARDVDAAETPPAVATPVEPASRATMPSPSPQGLVILRYTPVDAPPAQVLTVRVQGPSSPPAAVASSQPAPAPESSGS